MDILPCVLWSNICDSAYTPPLLFWDAFLIYVIVWRVLTLLTEDYPLLQGENQSDY